MEKVRMEISGNKNMPYTITQHHLIECAIGDTSENCSPLAPFFLVLIMNSFEKERVVEIVKK
jgi:hypothetical protein